MNVSGHSNALLYRFLLKNTNMTKYKVVFLFYANHHSMASYVLNIQLQMYYRQLINRLYMNNYGISFFCG